MRRCCCRPEHGLEPGGGTGIKSNGPNGLSREVRNGCNLGEAKERSSRPGRWSFTDVEGECCQRGRPNTATGFVTGLVGGQRFAVDLVRCGRCTSGRSRANRGEPR